MFGRKLIFMLANLKVMDNIPVFPVFPDAGKIHVAFAAHDGCFYLHRYLRTIYILKMNFLMPNLIFH